VLELPGAPDALALATARAWGDTTTADTARISPAVSIETSAGIVPVPKLNTEDDDKETKYSVTDVPLTLPVPATVTVPDADFSALSQMRGENAR
jgi:hypothetical protein